MILIEKLQEVIGIAGSSEDISTEQTIADRYLGETAIANFMNDAIDNQLEDTFNVAFGDYIILRGAEGWNGETIGAGLPDEIVGIDLTSLPNNDTGLVYRNEIIAYIKENAQVDESTDAVKDERLKIIP
jgi:hypothetical protein